LTEGDSISQTHKQHQNLLLVRSAAAKQQSVATQSMYDQMAAAKQNLLIQLQRSSQTSQQPNT